MVPFITFPPYATRTGAYLLPRGSVLLHAPVPHAAYADISLSFPTAKMAALTTLMAHAYKNGKSKNKASVD